MLRRVPPPASADRHVVEDAPSRASGDGDHDEVMGLITDLVADRLAPEERARVRDHLKTCPVCLDRNPVRDEDIIRRAMRMAYPEPTEREKHDVASRVSKLTGIRVSNS